MAKRIFAVWILLLLIACGSDRSVTAGDAGLDSLTLSQQLSLDYLQSLPEYSRFKQSGLNLKLISSKTDNLGMTHLRYQQQFQELMLQHAELITHEKNGVIYRVDGQLAKINVPSTTPKIPPEQAISTAAEYKKLSQPMTAVTRLLIVATDNIYDRLAWKVIIKKGLTRSIILVDAESGSILKEIAGMHTSQLN
jgi:Zn-dependent metalloprotease